MDEVTRRDDVGGVILTGMGEKAFVAGADIAELATMGPVDGIDVSRLGQQVFRRIELSREAGDRGGERLRAGRRVRAGAGVPPAHRQRERAVRPPRGEAGDHPRLRRHPPPPAHRGEGARAGALLTAQFIKADEAYRIGLANRVVPQAELMDTARKTMQTILANGPVAVGLAIECTTRGMEMSVDDGLALESNLFGLLAATSDMREGMSAFLEKRKAAFTGR